MEDLVEFDSLEERALSVPERAKALTVTDRASCERAGEILETIKALRGEVESVFAPVVSKAFEAHKAAVAARKQVEGPLIEAEAYLRGQVSGFLTLEQGRAEAEREALEANREAEIRRLEAAGDIAGADALRFAPRPETSAPPAVKSRTNWSWEVTDLAAVVRAVADGKAPSSILTIESKALGAIVRASRGEVDIPGIKVTQTVSAIVGGKSRA